MQARSCKACSPTLSTRMWNRLPIALVRSAWGCNGLLARRIGITGHCATSWCVKWASSWAKRTE